MNDLLFVINISIASSALMLMVLGLLLVLFIPSLQKWSKRFFTIFFSVLIIYAASSMVSWFFSVPVVDAHISKAALFMESLASSILIPLLTLYLHHCLRENVRKSPLMMITAALWFIYFLLLIIAQFTRWIYYYTPDQEYHRGPFYPLLLVPPVLSILINLVVLINKRSVLSAKQFYAFLIYLISPLLAMLLQMYIYGLSLIVLATAFAALFLFLFIVSDQVDQFIEQQKEIAKQQSRIMVLQMRPHFIYNTLMAIYSLCNQDPQKTRQVTLDFTNYLRKNFNAVVSESPVPFSMELEHTRAYLAVEQAQYEDLLLVEYDTPFTVFRLPPLTLQPIAENAVKHGMNPYTGPLHITIRTRHTDTGSVITVEDDGPGFDLSAESKPHVTLTNIRQRLQMMCAGNLEVIRREEGGTTVIVTIPDRSTDHASPAVG